MKRLGIECLFLLLVVPVWCQIKHTREETVEHYCNAHEVTSGDDFDHFDRVRSQIASVLNLGTRRIHFAVVDSNVINAWDNNVSKTESLICVPVATVRFMGEADGELAFVVAHEIGHAVDETCKSTTGRASVTPPTLAGNLSQLLGDLAATRLLSRGHANQGQMR